ncbi:MAG TPA: hypothetical protein VHZ55_09355 [Bryobacteraceae bacterium]|nr:hypothetical protein [Bryobacteraceae bacterium]
MSVSPNSSGLPGRLRVVATTALLVGAVGSVGFMLYAGRRNNSRLLLLLFTLWVLSPFVILLLANVVGWRWPIVTRAALYYVMLVLSLSSLAIYGYVALGPPRAKTAAVFVMVPPLSWLLMVVAIAGAGLAAGRRSRGDNS